MELPFIIFKDIGLEDSVCISRRVLEDIICQAWKAGTNGDTLIGQTYLTDAGDCTTIDPNWKFTIIK